MPAARHWSRPRKRRRPRRTPAKPVALRLRGPSIGALHRCRDLLAGLDRPARIDDTLLAALRVLERDLLDSYRRVGRVPPERSRTVSPPPPRSIDSGRELSEPGNF